MDPRECRVRPAQIAELAALAEIDSRAYGHPDREAQLARFCRGAEESHQLLLILSGQRPCGYLAYSRVLDEASIHDVAVEPQYQGAGLGKRLLQEALEHMKAHGVATCLLEVRASNDAAIALYRACGFQLDGERRNYYPAEHGRENALLMSRRL